ncbi:MAG: ATP phosphoribosyltransferase [Parvibaculaceae bacterium]
MSETKLILGLPSKGRLQENASEFFKRAGLSVSKQGGRGYSGTLKGVADVEIAFLSASEIAGNLEQGSIHFGVTGEDLIRENLAAPDTSVELLLKLGFGHADVVVAVPQSWIDVDGMADLDDVALAFHSKRGKRLRIATKYFNLTRSFFASHGINDYRIVESLGATEGAPAAGSAEAIVDITSTGATLAANGLKVLDDGVILKSEANLVASLTADWSKRALFAARAVLDRLDARERAESHMLVAARGPFDAEKMAGDLERHYQCAGDMVSTFKGGGELRVICPTAQVQAVAYHLREAGADTVSASKADYLFAAENALYERLAAQLGR